MDERRYRPPMAIVLAAIAAPLLGALYFAPWLELSAEPQKEVPERIYRFAPHVPAEVRQQLGKDLSTWSLASASGMHLASGQVRPYHDEQGMPAIQDGFTPNRRWAVFGAVMPAVFLLTCIATLARLVSKDRTGGYLAVGALVGIAVMTVAATVNFYDDLRNRVEQEGNVRAIRHDAQLAAMTGTFQSMQILGGSETFRTRTTSYYWMSLGLYGVVLVCGLVARVPEDTPPEPVQMGLEGPLLRHRLTYAARKSALPGAGKPSGPDFGPELQSDTPSGPPT